MALYIKTVAVNWCAFCDDNAASVIGLRLHYLVSFTCITMGVYILLIK